VFIKGDPITAVSKALPKLSYSGIVKVAIRDGIADYYSFEDPMLHVTYTVSTEFFDILDGIGQ